MSDHLDFSLVQLRYFVECAELGNISEAAQKLHASQSTVSAAVIRLERQLGVQLLHRHRARGVTVTPAGRRLLNEARALLRQARNLKFCGDSANDVVGQLDVGFAVEVAPFLLPVVYKMVGRRYGELTLNLREAGVEQLSQLLREGRCELAVTYDLMPSEFVFQPLVDLPVYALVPDEDPLAVAGTATLGELAARPLIALDCPRTMRYLARLFDAVPPVITTSSLETTRGLVAAGAGFALTHQPAEHATTLDGSRVRAVRVIGDVPALSLGVAMMPDLAVSSRAEAFVDVLKSVVLSNGSAAAVRIA